MKKYTVPTLIIAMLFVFTLLAGVSVAEWTDKWWDDIESYTKKKVSEMPYPAISYSIKKRYDRVREVVKDLKEKGLASFAKSDEESFKKEGDVDDTRITKRAAGEYRPPQEKEDSLTKLLREAREEVEKQEPRRKVEIDFAAEIAKFKKEQEMLAVAEKKDAELLKDLIGDWCYSVYVTREIAHTPCAVDDTFKLTASIYDNKKGKVRSGCQIQPGEAVLEFLLIIINGEIYFQYPNGERDKIEYNKAKGEMVGGFNRNWILHKCK
ncbi:MAG: hypothetical protein MUD12_15130 [Spirochaetes bacterium]|jgi:hypothetical protein|nr:hypothetical protein [Spirochaetota bacterium]